MRRTLLLCKLLAGCNAAGGPPAYLMLDADARRAGMKLELAGWSGSPVLPLELRAGEPVTLVGEGFRAPVELAPGKLRWVRGAGADLVTAEIDPDRLIVDGPPEAVRVLADLLAAETLDRDGLAELKAPDLFARASFLTAPEAIASSEPVAPRIVARTPLIAPVAATSGPALAIGELDPRASLVGLYYCDENFVVLDAEGGFRHGDQHGRWTLEEGQLLLRVDGGDTRALGVEEGKLRDVDGSIYWPLTEVCK